MSANVNNNPSTLLLVPAGTGMISSQKLYSCVLCSKLFISQNFLDQHINSVHGQITVTFSSKIINQNIQPLNHCIHSKEEIHYKDKTKSEYLEESASQPSAAANIITLSETENLTTKVPETNKALQTHNGGFNGKAYLLHPQATMMFPTNFDVKLNDKKLTLTSKNKDLYQKYSKIKKVKFSCSLCNITFSGKNYFLDHLKKIHNYSYSFNKSYICKFCKESFHSRYLYNLHKMIHTENIYKCEKCIAAFKEEILLKHHVATRHVEKEYICKYCNCKFSEKHLYSQHLKSHCSNKKHVCIVCKKPFDNKDLLTSHMQTHATKDYVLSSYSCSECDMKFTYDTLKNHKCRKATRSKKPFICDICQKQFKANSNLRDHYRSHTGEKPFVCTICQIAFSCGTNLKRHHLTHLGRKAYQCDLCHKGFDRKHMLKEHNYIHTGETPYKCDACSMEFNQSKLLLRHQEVHTGLKPFICEICNRGYSSKHCLTSHLRSHLGLRPHKCEFCHVSFVDQRSLKQHYLTHTGEKPYKCNICYKSFSRNTALQTHSNIHSAIKPWNCDICKKGFNQKVSLKFHLKKHHNSK